MLQLNPAETYQINRILRDWSDSTTYYVRAKVYDANSRALLATKDLTDNGSRWFSASYKVPHDNVYGNGTRLIIVTEVYTDLGYSSKSTNHFDEVEEVLVQQRYNPAVVFGGGDGGWDYKVLLKEVSLLMDKKLAKLAGVELEYDEKGEPKDLTIKSPEPIDLEGAYLSLYEAICEKLEEIGGTIGAQIKALPKPKDPKEIDLKPIQAHLAVIAQLITSLPKPKDPDYQPLVRELVRNLMLVKSALSNEIAGVAGKELTIAYADTPEEQARKKNRGYLNALKIKHGIK